MTELLVNITTFAAMFFAVFAVSAILTDVRNSDRRRVKKRMEERYREQQRRRARSSPRLKNFDQIAAAAQADADPNRSLAQRFNDLIEQSGVNTSISRVLFISGSLFMSVLLISIVFGAPLMGLAAGTAAGLLPLFYLIFKRKRRQERLRSQLPDAFELMARVLRAGQTVSQAMQAVSEEFSRPISLEFLYCSEQMNLGLSPEVALRDMQQRTGLLEIKILGLAIVVHRQTGGNLAELLDKLSQVVRERFRIHGMVQSLTAQGRFQAAILLALPPAMFVLLMILHFEYEKILLDFPLLIMTALGLMTVGFLWIRRIIQFDF